MKKTVLIMLVLLVFGLVSLSAQDQKTKKSTDSEVTLSVKMHCNDCAEKIKKQLAFTKGVKEVSPNLEKQEVVVKYRNDKTDVDKLVASLSEIGYTAKVVTADCPAKKSGSCCPGKAKNDCSATKTTESCKTKEVAK